MQACIYFFVDFENRDFFSKIFKIFRTHKKKKNNLSTTVDGRMKERRPRGQPSINWFTDVKVWTGMPGDEIRMASQRDLLGVISRELSSSRW